MDINQAIENLIQAIAQRERSRLLALFTDGMPGVVKAKATNGRSGRAGRASHNYGKADGYVKAAVRYIATNPGSSAGESVGATKYSGSPGNLMARVRASGHVKMIGARSAARYFPKG
jgi:hypothetical protein